MPGKKKTADPQKVALFALLRKRFGQVVKERKFDWLLAPSNCSAVSDFPIDYRKIVKSLCGHRGRTGFCTVRPCDAKLSCDFVVEGRKLIIEYDEKQHFTAPRKIALRHYPPDVVLPYSSSDWMEYCDKIDAHDNDPTYRDEQRAFYDSVRDIEAFRHGWTLLRIKAGDVDWKTANVKMLDNILSKHQGVKTMPSPTHGPKSRECKVENQKRPSLNIRKLGIVARDYNKTKDFKASLPEVLQLLDKKGCDAVLFSLLSLKPGYDPREVLKGLKNIKAVFVETFVESRITGRKPQDFVVYYRTPSAWKEYRLKQRFTTLRGQKTDDVRAFVQDEMPERFLGNCGVLICGESNVVKKVRENFDVFHLREAIPKEVRIILNPCHNWMKRPIMKKKRAYLSQKKRWVISVWCKGKKIDSTGTPWTIFYDGHEYEPDETIDVFEPNAVYACILTVQ